MAPSTSPASPPPAEAFGLDALSRFYRFHARIYDWTMRGRAQTRVARHGLEDRVRLDPRPYGTHRDYEGTADRILFSYSLSMVPPYREVLEQAARDLRRGGRIVAVDFLDARPPVSWGLRASHVHLGGERLEALRLLFPDHAATIRGVFFWRFFRFEGRAR
jgi:hypothetical protein